MNDIVDSFLTLTRMEVELRKAARSEVALNDLILDAVRHCQDVARERQLRLVPRLPLASAPGHGARRGRRREPAAHHAGEPHPQRQEVQLARWRGRDRGPGPAVGGDRSCPRPGTGIPPSC
ncbi:MAG: hypothetical protein M5U19_16460 [Microthrixaceae bacterium]|nr:hypothetical protein [Microthrixaceae bacterium]